MKRILVIENVVETRKFFLECLKAEGFSTMGVENGLLGIQRAQQDLPNLIISEIILPKLDGYSVLTTLRQNSATAMIPFIFVTTKVSRINVRKAMELGADDYLTQPCTGEELLGAIVACLEKRASLQKCYAAQSQPDGQAFMGDTINITDSQSIFPSHPLLSEVFRFIEANYHLPITLNDVAVRVGYSPSYLTNLVKRQTGRTVQSWIIEQRMTAARSLLLKTDQRVEEIAAQVGYQSVVHFFRQFRQHHQTTPQAWRNLQMNQHLTATK